MRINGENGKRRPGGGGESSADQPGRSINRKRSGSILRVAAHSEATPFGVVAEGDGWDCVPLGPYVDGTPIGMAVVPVSDTVELIVFVSARRKRGGS